MQNVTIGPSLGRDSIEKGVKATLVGALLVLIFMIFYYRLAGVLADFALILNVIMLLGAMAFFEATLTLPGIAGIILIVGMGIDSNVLILERIKEELKAGRTVRSAIDAGYERAWWTIMDSNITTLITAAVLFQFGSGPIKGFAVTLSLGILINLFTALVGTKVVYDSITGNRRMESLSI
jgi:preprotein translocase subunit SecD